MDDAEFEAWSASILSAGISTFADDIIGFPIRLLPAPVGTIGRDDPVVLSALGQNMWWLDEPAVQARLHAILLYQQASERSVRIPDRTGRDIEVDNPLFGATLLADVQQADDAVKRILADEARKQDNFLVLVSQLPEWCEHRIYVLSSALSRKIYWLPRYRRSSRFRTVATRP
ncbi:hypothetical protein [Sphingobium sp. BS19]|uniref:hypothetical protein n=1 Tax=Sphingobium sp. BS19 TaxID=3018973 RepID=UPI00249190DA|nr:hypothetical protein [Sphingobium sp. BS19]